MEPGGVKGLVAEPTGRACRRDGPSAQPNCGIPVRRSDPRGQHRGSGSGYNPPGALWDDKGGLDQWPDGGPLDATTGTICNDPGCFRYQGDAAPGPRALWAGV